MPPPPSVRAPLLRVPYTDPLPFPRIIPASARTASGAINAVAEFLAPSITSRIPSIPFTPKTWSATSSATLSACRPSDNRNARDTRGPRHYDGGKTVMLTGAGISVASGLADYRGTNGTYTLNKSYRPIYFNEYCESHEARKRYWARSFLGWTTLQKAKPNAAHDAVRRLGELGIVESVITQNVDSFHPIAHPHLPTVELHGYLRTLTCLSCSSSYSRDVFQSDLSRLNPAWHAFLQEMIAQGVFDTKNPTERKMRGLKMNPDGDVGVPGAPYTTFRYPACPLCLERPPKRADGEVIRVVADKDGAWLTESQGGVLKPSVIMFGESISEERKVAAEKAIDSASRILVVGSSLATYSAWRLVKRAKENGMRIGILNIGGVRGEDTFFTSVPEENTGSDAVRCSESAGEILPEVVKILEGMQR